jgi:hypothetical protein
MSRRNGAGVRTCWLLNDSWAVSGLTEVFISDALFTSSLLALVVDRLNLILKLNFNCASTMCVSVRQHVNVKCHILYILGNLTHVLNVIHRSSCLGTYVYQIVCSRYPSPTSFNWMSRPQQGWTWPISLC